MTWKKGDLVRLRRPQTVHGNALGDGPDVGTEFALMEDLPAAHSEPVLVGYYVTIVEGKASRLGYQTYVDRGCLELVDLTIPRDLNPETIEKWLRE